MKRREFLKCLTAFVALPIVGISLVEPRRSSGIKIITEEFNRPFYGLSYDQISRRYATALAVSMRKTKEVVAANVLNKAFG